MIKKIIYKFNWLCLILLAVCTLAGCHPPESAPPEEYLLRVGTGVMSVFDFKKELEIATTAYPMDIIKDEAKYREVKFQVLNQMIERMILLERAKELQIEVSDPELETAIAGMKTGYPEGEFEKTLLESAVSYEFWKKELKVRMIMEKVVARELGDSIQIDPDDIAKYHEEHQGQEDSESEKETDQAVTKQVYRQKTEDAYQSWIKGLQEKYTIDINQARWKEIAG
jgi:hypothetical protein